MDIQSISDIARMGMTFERSRLETATLRLAQANVPHSSFNAALKAAGQLQGNMQLFGEQNIDELGTQVKTIYKPEHPMANATGNVFFVNVDPVTEMAVLVTALRSYQANVRAFNTSSEFNQAALDIGSK